MQVMQSNKWTFSLAGLVVLLALGFVLMPTMAHKAEKGDGHLIVSFGLDTSVVDVSSESTATAGIEQDIQIDSGRVRAYTQGDADSPGYPRPFVPRGGTSPEPVLTFLVEFNRMVQLTYTTTETLAGRDLNGDGDVAGGDNDDDEMFIVHPEGFGLDDITVEAFDTFGRSWGGVTLLDTTQAADGVADVVRIAFTNPGGTPVIAPGERVGRQFTVEVYLEALEIVENLLETARGGDFEISTLIFSFTSHTVTEAKTLAYELYLQNPGNYKDGDINGSLKDDARKLHQGPEVPHNIRIDLVDVDEGNPRYRNDVDGEPITIDTSPATAAPYLANINAATNPSGYPNVVSITRLRGTSDDITLPLGYGVGKDDPADSDKFMVKVVLTEQPEASFLENNGADLIEVENGKVVGIDAGLPFGNAAEGAGDDPAKDAVMPPVSEGGYSDVADDNDMVPEPTGRDNRYWQYRVTIDPDRATTDNVIITVKEFDDKTLPDPKTYMPLTERQRKTIAASDGNQPLLSSRLKNGREILSVPVIAAEAATDPTDPAKAITDARLPHEMAIGGGTVIPAGGYLVLARGKEAGAGVRNVTAEKNTVKDDVATTNVKLSTAELLYNVKYEVGFPYPGDDLANSFRTGATIQLIYNDIATTGTTGKRKDADGANKKTGYIGFKDDATVALGDVVISEIMWGRDDNAIGKDDATNPVFSQWIELHNTTDAAISIDANEWHLVFGTSTSFSAGTVVDTVGNNPSTGYWEVSVGQSATQIGNTTSFTDTVSMYRGITAAGEVMDGEAQGSWYESAVPPINALLGTLGTPGAASPTQEGPAPPTTTPTTEPEVVVPTATPATAADIMISEIMVASDEGRFPQWIELTNTSTGAVSLAGWSVVIENDPADDDVIGSSLSIDIGDVEVGVDKDGDPESVLIVSKTTERNSGVGTGKGDLRADRIVDAQSQLSPEAAKYTFLSEMGFMISLMPPQTTGVTTYGNIVGNLGEGWEIPMAEADRSSIIRREMGVTGNEIMGTDAAGWVLASETMLDGAYQDTFYGHRDDAGTPGFDAGGALPVELSKFNAGRDRLTGQVMITWETQSELNNAGFFIKRSEQLNGKFVVVNPTMIAGAGTTAEKQSYTYTDATAKPNVLYYYQIEDVSLDGNRQTLTRAHRLKGHIGAAGKVTTRWGELKSQE